MVVAAVRERRAETVTNALSSLPLSLPLPAAAPAPSRRAVVSRPRACTLCRECIREPAWEPRVALERVNTHFLFSVESTGAVPAATLVAEAVKILDTKSRAVLEALDGTAGGSAAAAAAAAASSAATPAAAEGGFGGARGVPLLSSGRVAIYNEAVMQSAEDD